MMTWIFALLLTVFFSIPFAISARGHLRRRYAILIAVGLVIAVSAAATMLSAAIGPSLSPASAPLYYDFAAGYLYAIMIIAFGLPVVWWARRNKDALVRMVMLFGANFDPRLAPRGPVGRLGSNKYLSGTKPPTGSRRLAAWRERLTSDLLNTDSAKPPVKRSGKRR